MRNRIILIVTALFFCLSATHAQIPMDDDSSSFVWTFYQHYNPLPAQSYQRVLTPLRPTQDTAEVTFSATPENVHIVTQYFDLWGRPIQKVVKQASPAWKDYVLPVVYDKYGRVTRQYLPYVQQTGNTDDGKYKQNVLSHDSAFYRSIFPDEDTFYSLVKFDATPLQRVLKVTAEGDNWTGKGIGKTMSQRANAITDSVRLWTIDINSEDDVPATSVMYQAGSLMVEEVTDERGIKSMAYKDESGRTVLTKIQLSGSPSTGHAGWLCTYYIYDEMNALRMVIPPKAVEALLLVSWNLAGNASIRTGLCYAYYYDSKGRQVMKYIPGKGKSYIAYDLLDRVVMTQDPNLRQTGQWAFIKYDGQSRPIKSGLITSVLIKDSILAQAFRSMDYPALSGTYTITSESWYDDYSWTSSTPLNSTLVTTHINSDNFYTTYNTYPGFVQEITESKRIRGAATGSKKIIIGTSDYLYSLTLYDQYGRAIQVKETNYTGGTDVQTTQFDFSGKILRVHLAHEKSGANAQTHTVLTKYLYDHAGRIYTVAKNIDGVADRTIRKNIYNELGQLQTKRFNITPGQGGGISIEDQEYSYNIRGWLTGINKDYVTIGNAYRYFGEILYYESGFGNNQLNGAIGAVQWKAKSDGIARSYQFTYDNANRLTAADFNQQNEGSGSWTKDKVDFSVSGLAYDAGSNILSMKQRGLQTGSSTTIDSLTYQYFTNSNQLQKVSDGIAASGRLGDFKDTMLIGDDYTYDVNGNITRDYNRKMHTAANGAGAVYNVLDRADSLVIAGSATLYYYYDASGNKLRKQVNDYTSGTLVTKNYLYINGFVYLNDTLKYALHEEGRIRYISSGVFAYDYFLRDHLNNIRAVVTSEQKTDAYPVASMETAQSTTENNYYSNINTTRTDKPDGYPADTYTNPNDKVAKVRGDGNKIGPAMVLKVMTGDKFNIRVNSWYKKNGATPGTPVNPLTDLLNALNSNVGSVAGNHGTTTDLQNANTLNPGAISYYGSHNSADSITKPKAFINWVLFDEQFSYVSSSSGFEQVGADTVFTTHLRNDLLVNKSGYLYIYVSNETPNIDVYFDNLQVTHIRGRLLEENHYYPFGLTMTGISSRVLAFGQKNNYKFNGGVELEDNYGVNLYSTFFRQYDPQLGRFNGIDIRGEESFGVSNYNFAINNPISLNDPVGDKYGLPKHIGGGMYRMEDGSIVGWSYVESLLKWGDQLTGFWNSEDETGGGGSILSWEFGFSKKNLQYGFRIGYSWTFGKTEGDINQGLGIGNAFVSFNDFEDHDANWNNSDDSWYKTANDIAAATGLAAIPKAALDYVKNFYIENGLTKCKGVQMEIKVLSTGSKILRIVGAAGEFAGVVLPVVNMIDKGVTPGNSVDLTVGMISFYPGVGWVIGGLYYGIGETIGWPKAIEGAIFMEQQKAELRHGGIMNYSDWKN